MSKKKLFEYAVILHTTDDKGKVTNSKVIIQPTTILAKSESDVAFTVTREIPDEHAKNPDNVEIIIRNF